MPIRLDEIKGLMIIKDTCPDCNNILEMRNSSFIQYQPNCHWCEKCKTEYIRAAILFRNQAIDQQSSRKIKINPEKLAKLLHSRYMELIEPLEIAKDLRDWDNLTYQKECWLEDARAIIANEAELLEGVE